MGVLDGKAATVTGSARGIGRATAELLVEHGARVLINEVRFSAPVFPGEIVTTRVWQVDGAYGFESGNVEGKPVIRDGLAELR